MSLWESSSFWHGVLHWERSVHVKFFDLQEHLDEEQYPLNWHRTISGLGGPSLYDELYPTRCVLLELMLQLAPNFRWAMLAWPHIMAWIWTLRICCLKAPRIGRSLSLAAMCLQERCHRRSGMLVIWMPLGTYAARRLQLWHGHQIFSDFRGLSHHLQSVDDFTVCFDVDLQPTELPWESTSIVWPRECVKGR